MGTKDFNGDRIPPVQRERKELKVSDQLFEADISEPPSGLATVASKLKLLPWIKKNPNIAKAIAAGSLVSIFVLVAGLYLGWFDSSESAPASPSVASDNVSHPNTAVTSNPPVQPTQALPVVTPVQPLVTSSQPAVTAKITTTPIQTLTPPVPPPQATNGADKEKSPVPLPKDVRSWTKDDYLRARRQNDPNLIAAVRHLGQSYVGGAAAATALVELLKPLPKAEVAAPPTSQPAITGPVVISSSVAGTTPTNESANLIDVVIEALEQNGTDIARQAIEQVILGEFTTDDNKAAVEAALKTLLKRGSDASDTIVVRAITAPEELRPAERENGVAAKELQAKALELAKSLASLSCRTKLAEALLARTHKPDLKDPVVELLLSADPRNCGALLVFSERADLPTETKATIEQQLVGYSSKELANCLGIPESSMQGISNGGHAGVTVLTPSAIVVTPTPSSTTVPNTVSTDNRAKGCLDRSVAVELWSKKSLAAFEPKLRRLTAFDKQPQHVLLAATMPCESTRSVLARVLKQHWYEGPKALDGAGLVDKITIDPGFLVLLKLNPRREQKTTRPGSKSSLSSGPANTAKLPESLQKRIQAEQDWLDLSSRLTASFCKQLAAAADAKAKAPTTETKPNAAAKPADTDEDGHGDVTPKFAGAAENVKLPGGFALHPDARVSATYHVSWPTDLPPQVAAVQPGMLDLYFVQAKQAGRPKKVAAYYARQAQARTSDVHVLDATTWIDVQRIGQEKDRRRSIDVRLTKEGPSSPDAKDADAETELTVEVLLIEIKDPLRE